MIKTKNYIKIIAVVMIFAAIWCLPMVFACSHENTSIIISTSPTCTEVGQEDIICVDCGETINSNVIEPIGHSFDTYTITVEPSADKNGIESSTCSNCGLIDEREYICPHDNTQNIVVSEATCVEAGQENVICDDCGAIVENIVRDPLGHSIEKYKITVKPSFNRNGIQTGTCSVCKETVETEYICPHEKTYVTTSKEATCYADGVELTLCSECDKIIEETSIPAVECIYGDWNYIEYATPFEEGSRYRICSGCGNKESESYSITMSENYVYAPGTGINCPLAIASFTQHAVDSHDVIYTYATEWGCDRNNPFILGHNTGTLQHLPEIKVGQDIYVSVNGNILTYRVVTSEFALQNASHTNIFGQSSGHSMFDSIAENTLHMYTCYKDTPNGYYREGRWLVLAELVS